MQVYERLPLSGLKMPRPRKISVANKLSEELRLPSAWVEAIDPAMPKTAQVYEIIRKAIVNLVLPPGSNINEKSICEQLQISRTPLREAILQLQAENLV